MPEESPKLNQDLVDIEQNLLCSLLIRPDLFPECDVVTDAFSRGFHRHVHEAMCAAWEDGDRDLDVTKVLHYMVENKAIKEDDQEVYVEAGVKLADILAFGFVKPTAVKRSTISFYSKKIMEHRLRRGLSVIKQQTSVAIMDREKEADELLQHESDLIDEENDIYLPRYGVSIETSLDEAEDNMKRFGDRIPLGIVPVQEICGDLLPGQVLTIIGRTSVGKTYFVTNLINAMTKLEDRSFSMLFASLEMSEYATITRLARAYHLCDIYELDRDRRTPVDKRRSYVQAIKGDVGFHFKHASSFNDISRSLRQWERSYGDHPVGVVFLDYLQYLRTEGNEKPYERGSRLAREAKEFAKEHKVLLVLLSQIKRTDKDDESLYRAPSLTDARDSGAIEESADVMLGLWRDKEAQHVINCKTLKVRDGTRPGLECSMSMNWDTGIMSIPDYRYIP